MDTIKMLGLEINIRNWDKANQLPFYILNNFSIQNAIINDISCLSLTPCEELPNLSALKKQINVIREVEDLPIFLYLDSISNFKKQNLLDNKIPFILKDKMVYLPLWRPF